MTTRTKRKTKEVIPLPEQEEELLYTVELPEGINLKQPEEPKPYVPKMFEVYQLPEDGTGNLPDSPRPYYPITKDGMFLHKNLLIGRALVQQKTLPKSLKGLDEADKNGGFWWKAPKIPADICAQIVHFFRRIYDKQQTEAEVLLLLNHKTMEWAIHIPTQQVSAAGVKSVYEPSDIPKDYIVVGTMHSHCNFGAFHSSTDTTDAGEFDGVHITIGYLLREIPEIAAMVMVNKQQFTYKNVSVVADFSDLEAATAPEEWDDYVTVAANLVSGHKPKGYELFDKYKEQPKAVVPWTPSPTTQPHYQSHYPNYGTYRYPYPTAEKRGFESDWSPGHGSEDDWSMWDEYFNARYPNPDNADKETDEVIKKYDAEYWEEGLPTSITDAIILSNCLQEKDIDYVMDNFMAGVSMIHWRNLYLSKLSDAVGVLNALGIEVNYQARPKKFTREDSK